MRDRSLLWPWGYWQNGVTLGGTAPVGFPSSVDNASTILGLPCKGFGPMTIDEAMEFFWRVEQATVSVTVDVPALGIGSSTNATAFRYTEDPNTGTIIASGDERLLITDAPNAFDATQPTKGWYGASYTAGGITWTLKLVTRYLWLDLEDDVAIFSLEAILDWTQSSGPDFSFQATQEIDEQVGTCEIDSIGTLVMYGNEQDDAYTFSVELFYSLWYERKTSAGVNPLRVAATGAYPVGVTYALTNLSDLDINA